MGIKADWWTVLLYYYKSAKVIQGKYKGTVRPFVPADMGQASHKAPEAPPATPPKPSAGISEVAQPLKRGFLDAKGGVLYPEGTTAEGVLPEGAGDPLGHIPKSIRDRSKIIDLSKTPMNEVAQKVKEAEAKPPVKAQPAEVPKPVKAESSPSVANSGLIPPGTCDDFARLMKEMQDPLASDVERKEKLITEYDKKHKAWPHVVDVSPEGLVTVKIQIPDTVGPSSLGVDVTADHIDFGNFVIPFKMKVDAESAVAKFSKKTGAFIVAAMVMK